MGVGSRQGRGIDSGVAIEGGGQKEKNGNSCYHCDGQHCTGGAVAVPVVGAVQMRAIWAACSLCMGCGRNRLRGMQGQRWDLCIREEGCLREATALEGRVPQAL